jgi:hypothetical protein
MKEFKEPIRQAIMEEPRKLKLTAGVPQKVFSLQSSLNISFARKDATGN